MITRAVGSSWCASCSCSAQASFHRSLRMKRRTFAVLDVDPVTGGIKNVRTGDVVQFQEGRTLPIKVRIEDGAFGATNPDHVEQVVPSHIATPFVDVTTSSGFAGARFFDGWLPLGI